MNKKSLLLGILMLVVLTGCGVAQNAEGRQLQNPGAKQTATGEPKEIAAGKVGICHRTGSEKNPWEFIVVDDNAVPAHRQHGDIINVKSAADCPKTSAPVTPTLTCTPTTAPQATLTVTRTPTPTITATRTVTLTIPQLITPTQTLPPSVRC